MLQLRMLKSSFGKLFTAEYDLHIIYHSVIINNRRWIHG
jgi:hypothetical protein